MARVSVYGVQPQSGFHFGVRGVGVEASDTTGSSDMLFGAICNGLRALRGAEQGESSLGTLLDACRDGEPPFLVSSLFPYAGQVLLLPRPLQPLPLKDGAGKEWRKVNYLSWRVFDALVRRGAGGLDAVAREENLLQGRQVLVTAAEKEMLRRFVDPDDPEGGIRLWEKRDSTRVTVDRVTNSSQVYQEGWVRYPRGAGLYFMVEWRDERWREAIEEVLYYLEEEGLGGRRNSSLGAFQLEPAGEAELPGATGEETARMTLSLYHPTRQEAGKLSEGWYGLKMRRGWVGAHGALAVRRKDVLMLAEGSVLPLEGEGPFGGMVDVTPERWPEHVPQIGTIMRYGFALTVGVPYRKERSQE
ncbi:MAG TPA: type III-A CRISPR-associated RAMP protein Csm4 [Chloroflexia bacterium]|nr:type III-A CRISPR-associated RAMP protein Csm4 [Chloroflexia bacterium]